MKTNQNEEVNSRPTFTSASGKVRACVWETREENTFRHKITLSRLFREDNGSWQRGRTFFASELAQVVEAVGRAQTWIDRRRRQLEFSPPPGQAET